MSPNNWLVKRFRAVKRVEKLLALAAGNTNQNEAESAMAKAQEIAREFDIDLKTMKPREEPITPGEYVARNRDTFSKFGRATMARYGEDEEDYT